MDLLHGPAFEESFEDAPPLSRSKLADIRGKDVREEPLRLAKIGQGSGKYASRRWSHSSVFFPGSCLQCQDEGPCFRFLRLSVCPFSLLLPSIMLPGPLAYSTAWHNWGYPHLFLYVFVQLLMQSKTHSGPVSALCRFPLLTIYQLIRTAWFAPFFLIHYKCLLRGYSSAYMFVPFLFGHCFCCSLLGEYWLSTLSTFSCGHEYQITEHSQWQSIPVAYPCIPHIFSSKLFASWLHLDGRFEPQAIAGGEVRARSPTFEDHEPTNQPQPGTPSPLSSYQASLCPIPEEIQRIQSHLHDTVDGRNPAPLGFV